MAEMVDHGMTRRTQARSSPPLGEGHLPTGNLSRRRKAEALEETADVDSPLKASGGDGAAYNLEERHEDGMWQLAAQSITPGDIDNLIGDAMQCAGDAQGSLACGHDADSQAFALNSNMEQHGSGQPEEAHSQKMRAEVQRLLNDFLEDRGASCAVGDLGKVLLDVLTVLEKDFRCRPRPTTGKKDIFPLPVSGHPIVTQQGSEFLQLMAACLNSMHGTPDDDRGRPSSLRALKRLQGILVESVIVKEPLKPFDFSQLFLSRTVDYQGEEMRLARKVVWDSIEASLPSHVGMLDIRDHCEGGVLHYITHFEEFLLPVEDQIIGKPPRVFVDDPDWEIVARGLLDRRLCVRRKLTDLHHVGGSL